MKHPMQLTDSKTPATTGPSPLLLFPVPDAIEQWERDPSTSFQAWLASKETKISLKSAKIYSYMWGKFTRWRRIENIGLSHVRSAHIERFLNHYEIKTHHRYRYVRLIERVYQHLALSNPGLGNPGSQAAKQKVGEAKKTHVAFLTEDQRVALIQWIVRDLSGETHVRKDEIWKEKRDLAIAAAMLGGGVKVGEAQTLSVSCITDNGAWLAIEKRGGVDHKTCLLPFARDAIRQWVEQRNSMGLPGGWLFVSREDGRKMDAATIYRRVQRVMQQAGVRLADREGPHTLRNTFFLDMLETQVPDGVMAGYLGLREAASIDRLRTQIMDAQTHILKEKAHPDLVSRSLGF